MLTTKHGFLMLLGRGIYKLGLAKWIIRIQRGRIRRVLYHAVDDVDSPYNRGLRLSVTPETLECQLDYFSRHYRLVESIDNDEAVTPPALMISFDDGYSSVYHNAWPILQKYNAPVTVFLVTSAVQQQLLWYNALNWALHEHGAVARQILSEYLPKPLPGSARNCVIEVQEHGTPECIKNLQKALSDALPFDASHQFYLTSAQINEMADKGMSFGFHTVDHYNLINCDAEELAIQLDAGELHSLISENSLAYPYGYYNASVLEHAVSRGFDPIMCVGIDNERHHHSHQDRVEIDHSDAADIFAQLEVAEPVLALFRRWMRRETGRRSSVDVLV